MHTFIKRYLFDDAKLRDRALLEFTRGLRDGRMIAMTGAMATEALGYFDWPGACRAFSKAASDLKREVLSRVNGWAISDRRLGKLLDIISEHCKLLHDQPSDERKIDVRVHFSVIREAFDALDEILALHGLTVAPRVQHQQSLRDRFDKPLREELDLRFAANFVERRREGAARASPIKPLLENLGITRFVTLNYDFELERALMLRIDERNLLRPESDSEPARKFRDFVGPLEAQREITLDPIKRLRRTRADGLTVESDVLDRERVDRLIEFAVGSANVDYHLLHLHGRADAPSSMVVDIRDYDRLYRRDDLFKNPFEHGRRVLFAGNPVLFVGVGMTEAEINATLQDFVSDSPYRRTAPAFLLWNTTSFSTRQKDRSEEKRLRRIDFLQRLGVYVIFDDDIIWKSAPNPDVFRRKMARLVALEKDKHLKGRRKSSSQRQKRALSLEALRCMVAELPESVGKIEGYGDRVGNGWRNVERRCQGKDTKPVRLWGTPRLAHSAKITKCMNLAGGSSVSPAPDGKLFHIRFKQITDASAGSAAKTPLLCGLSAPGFGRGLLAEWLLQKVKKGKFGDWEFAEIAPRDRLLVNAGFSYDSDALLSGIADFLWARHSKPTGQRPCRELFFASGEAFNVKADTLVIVNGIDRFFGYDGAPLSAEIDHLLRCIAAPKKSESRVKWVLLGTERLARYLRTIGQTSHLLELVKNTSASNFDAEEPQTFVGSRYLGFVAERFEASGRVIGPAARAKLLMAHNIGRDALRRAFFSAYLSPIVLGQTPTPSANQTKPVPNWQMQPINCALAFEILRAMAFIGWPVEVGVLAHVPRVAALLADQSSSKPDETLLTNTMEQLRHLGLLIEILKFDARWQPPAGKKEYRAEPVDLTTRFGLHRSMATELRERHGIPLSEAKLSSTFNMSLFAAQPADDYTPEPEFHDELGNLVDRLIGAWKDPFPHGLSPDLLAKVKHDDLKAIANHPADNLLSPDDFVRICSPRAVACLRAALAVIRGYYSTSNLLAIDLNDRLASVSRDGALTEHSNRLDRLLKGFGKIATARDGMRAVAKLAGIDDFSEQMGPEPFYRDDLVWLHNERGVVKLAQGDLYGARRSFSLALRMNNLYVEQDHKGHNWRRITVNMIGVLIERGRLRSAETSLDEIEASINRATWASQDTGVDPENARDSRFARILETYGKQNGFIDDCSSREFTREEILMVGLVTGYRGLIGQNRGHEKTAKGLYERSISILRRLGEQRSYALFQRHYASLRQIAHVDASMQREVALAIAAADAAHQMDMSYRARLLRADLSRRTLGNAHQRKTVLADIDRALRYAALTDSYRVRIEASSSLSRLMLESGEFDAALKYACDAMAVASRFGHSLHKIALRVQIGDILIQRGDPKSGGALLDEALSLSARIGYYRIVERVQRARRSESSLMSASSLEAG